MEAATEKLIVTLPDGKPLELPAGATGADAAAAIGPGLAKAAAPTARAVVVVRMGTTPSVASEGAGQRSEPGSSQLAH
jgi:hypothetical protein